MLAVHAAAHPNEQLQRRRRNRCPSFIHGARAGPLNQAFGACGNGRTMRTLPLWAVLLTTVICWTSIGYCQSAEHNHLSATCADGRQIDLLDVTVAERWQAEVDGNCTSASTDLEVARIRLRISYPSERKTPPSAIRIIDVLGRQVVEPCRLGGKKPITAVDPTPSPQDLTVSIPVRPNTPLKALHVDDVRFDLRHSQHAPN